MYRHLLVPTDGSPLSVQAVGQALQLAAALGAQATILTVVEPFYSFAASPDHQGADRERYERHAREAAEAILADAREQAATLGVTVRTKAVGSEHPDQMIIDVAASSGCDLIAMASHGRRGVGALLLGSVTRKVLTHASLPVLVLRPASA